MNYEIPASYRPLTEEPKRSLLYRYNLTKGWYLDALHSRQFTRADLEVLRSVAQEAGNAVNDCYGDPNLIKIETFSNAYTSDMRHLRGYCGDIDPETGKEIYYK